MSWSADSLLRAELRSCLERKPEPGQREARETRAMLAWMEGGAGGHMDARRAAKTWVWADLHLNHPDIVECFGRPFRTADGMRRALLETWRRMVADDQVMICLGDVAVGPAHQTIDDALALMPGEKLLVAGNHEFVENQRRPKDYGFEAVHPTLTTDTEPKLLLTHQPLGALPTGCVNVHGHLHGAAARRRASRSARHLNVNVELTSYQPVRLSDVLTAARALLAGHIEPQATTTRTVAAAKRAAREAARSGSKGQSGSARTQKS